MNEKFFSIDERMDFYRRTKDIKGISNDKEFTEESDTIQIYPIVQNRTLDMPFRIMISVYEPNGIETSYYGNRSYRFKHKLPFTGVLHKHEFIEIFYVIDGYFEQILLGEKYHFEAGEFVITDQNCEHSDYLVPVDASVFFLQVRADYFDELLHLYDENDELHRFLFHALSRQKKEQSFLRLQNVNEGTQKSLYILERLFEEISEKEFGYSEICKGLLLRLLQNLCMNYRPIVRTDTQESKEKTILYEVERFIRLNYANVNSCMLEEMFHYHRNYYNLLIKKYRGVTLKNYLVDIRLSRADELLRTTQLPVKEIAQMVGYENTSHFYHIYKNKYGHLPRH
jgi:AraC-like DNA-binding protein